MKRAADIKEDYYFRVISNQVRFGYGFRTVDGNRQKSFETDMWTDSQSSV